MIYLDNSATTMICQESLQEINYVATECFGNPSSLHGVGLKAEKVLIELREQIARNIGCNKEEIFLTSGGTEANNIAVQGGIKALKRRGNRIVTTAVEHSSVYECMKRAEDEGFDVVYIKPDTNGNISIRQIADAINEKTILVSVMLVNNEVGSIFPVEKIRKIVDKKCPFALIHCDCVQAFGKIPINVNKLGVDLLTISSHKVHGPKGAGALYKRKGKRVVSVFCGGEQQEKVRPGTEPTLALGGFLGAVKGINNNIIIENANNISNIRDYLVSRLEEIDGVIINSPPDAIPYIVNFSLVGKRSETIMHYLEARDIYVSSGSACSKGNPSRTLKEMGLSNEIIDSALRVSFSIDNTIEDVEELVDAIEMAKMDIAEACRN